MFRIQRVSNHGTSTTAVARTFCQGREILGFFAVTEAQREEAKKILIELQRHLVRCIEISDCIEREATTAREEVKAKGLKFQSFGRVVTLPSVPDLRLERNRSSSRQSWRSVRRRCLSSPSTAKNMITATTSWQLGPRSSLEPTISLRGPFGNREPWVKSIVDMRNAADHPDETPSGKLLTQNFNFRGMQDITELVDPTWSLSGELQRPILGDMKEIVEGIIELGEEVLAGLFYKLKLNLPLVINEIPAQERDPACPIRLRVGFAKGNNA